MILLRLIMLLLSIFLIVAPLLYLSASKEAFTSFIVAYSTSSLILIASFKSYKSMVDKRLSIDANVAEFDDRDSIDKLEDPYNLYSEDEEIVDESISLKEAIKKEKKLLKKNRRSFSSFMKDSSIAFSFLRLGAYAIFVFGFFYLLKSSLLSLPFYLATIIIPNVIVVVYLQLIKGKAY